MRVLTATLLALTLAFGAQAQDASLADLRAELALLSSELEALRTEASGEGHAGLSAAEAGGVLVRLDQLAENLRAVTGRIEATENRVMRIAEDGARRIRDAEFRLTELEGGDTALLSDNPTPLGETRAPATQVQRGEDSDFEAAQAAFDAGDMSEAARLLTEFVASYPDGERAGAARLMQGQALAEIGDNQNAARAFLKSFSGAPDAPSAPHALFGLAVALEALGQHDQACLTLAEVLVRYPSLSPELARDVAAQKSALACP